MSLLARLLALFVVVPLLELALLLQVGRWIGLVPTVLLVILTGAVGAALTRREGLRTVGLIRGDLAAGRFPLGRLLDGAMILAAGALLLTPGVLTDVIGLALLLPGTRDWLRGRLAARLRHLVETGRANVTLYYDDAPPPGRPL